MSKLRTMNAKYKMVLITTFVMFLLLFNSPFITLPWTNVGGLPGVMIYIAVCWVALIIWMRIIPSNREND